MSVNVRIKQKSLFKKKLNLEDIIKLSGLSYGVSDENYRLIRNELGNHTLLYNENKLARGIDVSLDGNDIVLLLSLPTSISEIREFYEVIEKICNKLKIKNYIREEENVSLTDKEKFIQYDEQGSINGLKQIEENITQDKYKRLEIFGIYNPISLGIKEVKKIGTSLDKFADFLHNLQALDVYYSTPMAYKVKEKLVGIYAIGPNIPSVVPLTPYIVLNQIEGIEEWYVVLKEGKTIKYDNFINNVSKKEYYDVNHVIVTLSDKDVATLLDKYLEEI